MPYLGYYINLDRSPERRAAMEARLARLDPPGAYHRFPGADGNPRGFPNPILTEGQIGCLTSHYLLLREHRDGANDLHVLEDDAVLAHRAVRFVEQFIAAGGLDDLDVVFTSTYLPEDFSTYQMARDAWRDRIQRAADGTSTDVDFITLPYYASTSSYLVNRRSIGVVCDIIGDELTRGARLPVDLTIREAAEQGRLRAKCLFPFITSVLPAEFASTIDRGDAKRRWTLVMDLLRHSFFVECDLPAMADLADRMLTNFGADAQDRLHARIAGFISSNAYRTF